VEDGVLSGLYCEFCFYSLGRLKVLYLPPLADHRQDSAAYQNAK